MICDTAESSVPETVSRAEEEDATVLTEKILFFKVPEGTVIKEASTGKVIVDMSLGANVRLC